jgi:hypothetical protein
MPTGKQPLLTAFFAPMGRITPKTDNVSVNNKSEKRKFIAGFNKKNDPDKTRQWEGYLFIAEDNFREYTVINLLPRPNYELKMEVPAGYKVASATVDNDSALTHIQVVEQFRRQKIGSELVRFIKNCCKQFTVFGGTEHNSRYRLTEQGAALVTYCVANKILASTQVITAFVPRSPMLK